MRIRLPLSNTYVWIPYHTVPVWTLRLHAKLALRNPYSPSKWRTRAMLREDQQRRIIRKMRRILCH